MSSSIAVTVQPSNSANAVDRRRAWLPMASLVIVVLTMTLRPGDASWIYDEPRLISTALHFSAEPTGKYLIPLSFSPAEVGLKGSRGVNYGPAPVWFYQLCLWRTHNLLAIIVIRTILCGGTTALAALWLTRVLRVSPWLAVVVMLSPWIWHHSRQLWDNSFNIPLSALLLASYGDFLVTRRPWPLRLAVSCIAIMPLVHFMCLAIVIPVAIHLAVFHFRSLRQWKWSLLGVVAAVHILAWPYWAFLAGSFHPDLPHATSAAAGWFFPLLGAHHLTAAGLGEILGGDWPLSFPSISDNIALAQSFTLIAYPVCWIGMVLAIIAAARVFRRGSVAQVTDHLALIGLATWFCQSVLDGLERIYGSSHYFDATWIVYAMFVWLAADALGRTRWWFWGGLTLAVYSAMLIFVLSAAAGKIIRDGGSKYMGYGTTLGNQMAAMQRVKSFSDDSILRTQLPEWGEFRFAFQSLWDLTPPPSGPRPAARLWIHYRNDFPGDARIVVDVAPLSTTPAPPP